jgi:hypothetical protein
MLQETINAYLFDQYSDDEDVQGFIDAYNQATQYFVNWFSQIGLSDWTNLQQQTVNEGDANQYTVDPGLLDWVLTNLYGMPRPSFTQSETADVGSVDTMALASLPLNVYTFGTELGYYVDDDWYQRIATWNLYAADGKNFSMLWLKRRIMRFMLGLNGTDPAPGAQPSGATLYAGCETTWPIGVTVAVSSGVRTMTIIINQSALSTIATNLRPNICAIFEASLLGGVLEMPVQYQYVVNIETAMSLTIEGLPASYSAASFSEIGGSVTANVSGGTIPYTYAWNIIAGSGITVVTPTAQTTVLEAEPLPGTTVSANVQCLVTDYVGYHISLSFPVSIKNTIQAILNAKMVASTWGNDPGTPNSYGYLQGTVGTLSPSTDKNGNIIRQIAITGGATSSLLLQWAEVVASNYFTELFIPELGLTLYASNASYNGAGGRGDFSWVVEVKFTVGSTYTIVIA